MSKEATILVLQARLTELAAEMTQRQLELVEEMNKRKAELAMLTRESDALKLALQSLENIQDDVFEGTIGDSLTYKQRVVFENIPVGRENALPPALITKRCLSIDPDYVRKTLKRMSDDGRINGYDSKYWRDS